jgi:hypothetical protein
MRKPRKDILRAGLLFSCFPAIAAYLNLARVCEGAALHGMLAGLRQCSPPQDGGVHDEPSANKGRGYDNTNPKPITPMSIPAKMLGIRYCSGR